MPPVLTPSSAAAAAVAATRPPPASSVLPLQAGQLVSEREVLGSDASPRGSRRPLEEALTALRKVRGGGCGTRRCPRQLCACQLVK